MPPGGVWLEKVAEAEARMVQKQNETPAFPLTASPNFSFSSIRGKGINGLKTEAVDFIEKFSIR